MQSAPLDIWEGHDVEHWRQTWHAGELRFFESVTSTNDLLRTRADAGAPHFSIVVAEEQTHGRGRSGAQWTALPGTSLLFSVLFREAAQGAAPGCAAIRVGLAVAAAIADVAVADARVKWPNDVVMTPHGKVAGVLCEGSFGLQRTAYVIAGIGINVLQQRDDFPEPLRASAASILTATGREVSRAELLTSVLGRLRQIGQHLTQPLSPEEHEQLSARDVLRGRDVICDLGRETVAGIARGVASDGALLVEQHGTLVPVYNGTVRLSSAHAYPGSAG